MSEKRFSRRRLLACSGVALSSGCLNFSSGESQTATSDRTGTADSTTANTDETDRTDEPTATEEQYADLQLTEEWSMSLEEIGRHIHLTESAVVLSGDGIFGFDHDDGSELFHAFSNFTSNRTDYPADSPFISVEDRIYAFGAGSSDDPYALLAVSTDGSGQASHEIPNAPGGFIAGDDGPMVHLPTMREHEVSADGATDVCSVGGGELASLSPQLETTTFFSLPQEMCSPQRQMLTPDNYIVKTDTYVRVIARTSGEERWKKPIEATEMLAHDGTLYLSTLNYGFIGLDIETGERVWEFGQSLANLFAHNNVLYGTQLDTVAIDLSTNEVVWRGQKRGDTLGTPDLRGGVVVVPTTEYVYGFDPADGDLVYQTPLPVSDAEFGSHQIYVHSNGLYVKSDNMLRRFSIGALT